MAKITDLIGKEVKIYPGDSYKKTGIIEEMNDCGVLFRITSYSGDDGNYEVGQLRFISYSSNLNFQTIIGK